MAGNPEQFDSDDLAVALEGLSPELQQTVLDGIHRAKEAREFDHEVLQFKTTIAEFAAAIHLNEANRGHEEYNVDVINWDHLTTGSAASIIHQYRPELDGFIPDSVRKTVAYVHAQWEFLLGSSRQEVDELLEPFGYPTSRILDDLVASSVTHYEAKGTPITPSAARQELDEYVEQIVYFDDITKLQKIMRVDMLTLGYQLPELAPDNSYGHDSRGGDCYPRFTPDMLP